MITIKRDFFGKYFVINKKYIEIVISRSHNKKWIVSININHLFFDYDYPNGYNNVFFDKNNMTIKKFLSNIIETIEKQINKKLEI